MMLSAISNFKMEMIKLDVEYEMIVTHINDSFLSLIEEYMMQKTNEFASIRITTKELEEYQNGYYVEGSDSIVLNSKHCDFNKRILANDMEGIKLSIETCLHESRHAFQEKNNYLIKESKEYDAEFDLDSMNEMDRYVVYYCNPTEEDARRVSREYTLECYEYIMQHLVEELENRLNNRRRLVAALLNM